jgi:hypothetical protein
MDMLLKQAKEFEREAEIVDKHEVITVMMDKWEAGGHQHRR